LAAAVGTNVWSFIKTAAHFGSRLRGYRALVAERCIPKLTRLDRDRRHKPLSFVKTAAHFGANVVGDIGSWDAEHVVPTVTGWVHPCRQRLVGLKSAAHLTGLSSAISAPGPSNVALPAIGGALKTIEESSLGPWLWKEIKAGWDGVVHAGTITVDATGAGPDKASQSSTATSIKDAIVGGIAALSNFGWDVATAA